MPQIRDVDKWFNNMVQQHTQLGSQFKLSKQFSKIDGICYKKKHGEQLDDVLFK